MKKYIVALLVILIPAAAAAQTSVSYSDFFVNKTLRLDYYHTGTKTLNVYSFDKFREEGPWAGSKTQLIDNTNLGKYSVRVYDLQTNMLVYSRGFCSLFGEWQTTGEAAEGFKRTFNESVLVPYPKHPVQIVIAERDRKNVFHEMYSVTAEPGSRFINMDRPYKDIQSEVIIKSGPPAEKVDLLFIGEGYTAEEMDLYIKDVKMMVGELFKHSPFKENKNNFNITAAKAISEQSGPDEPRKGVFNSTAAGASFNAFDLPRYMLSDDNRSIRDIAGNFAYDKICIIVNSERYGGGGIFNLYSVCAARSPYNKYVFVHEFGHAFAGLADEYYSSAVAYNDFYPRGVEPWEPNITALLDKTNVKWQHLIAEGTPVPTPASEEYKDVVGVFEGAGYSAKGLYRAKMDCIMFSKEEMQFCPVCAASIKRVIDLYSK